MQLYGRVLTECWASDFTYAEYSFVVEDHLDTEPRVTEEEYDTACAVLDKELVDLRDYYI